MGKNKATVRKPIEKRGGYSAGDKLVSELKPPPTGPAPGAKQPGGDSKKS
jgi:hypothetical protein